MAPLPAALCPVLSAPFLSTHRVSLVHACPRHLQIYQRAQVDTLRHLEQQTDKAIKTTVDAKLKAAEEAEGRELDAAVVRGRALARPSMTPVKCSTERAACVECYRYACGTTASQGKVQSPLNRSVCVCAVERRCTAEPTVFPIS
jgi:hypothetical protein